MKKWIALLLVLLFAFPGVASAQYDLSGLSDAELLMLADQVILELASRTISTGSPIPVVSSSSAVPGMSGEQVEMLHVQEDKYLELSGDWQFHFYIENTTDTDLFIRSLTFLDNGEPEGYYCDAESRPDLLEMMMGPDFAVTPLRPGEILEWHDAHPGEYLTSRIYAFVFAGADGREYTATYAYNLLMETESGLSLDTDFATDEGQNLLTLRHDADFAVPVFDGVFWVPAVSLGASRYANVEIAALMETPPEIRQAEIATLYEALQLYQVGGFASSDDNIRMEENGLHWEHHKPGYYAVTTNNGCCATSANWLNYILRGDYEEVGFVATSQRDGSGHIFNYIKQDGWYYFIDLTHYRTDWVATAVESGAMDDYYNSDFILGNIHMTESVEAYVAYIQEVFGDPPGLMFQYTADDCLAIDSVRSQDGVSIVYEANPEVALNVIFDDPHDSLNHYLTDPPVNRPNWG